ncbi:MAG: hypothetical protein GWN58_16255, partial [Anaerolineae bacterium]|nr:hypothetical protein [Anaerolineae bacterium]
KASNLKVDVAVSLSPIATLFKRFTDYNFDDPVRDFRSRRNTILESRLDSQGNVEFSSELGVYDSAPGMLKA